MSLSNLKYNIVDILTMGNGKKWVRNIVMEESYYKDLKSVFDVNKEYLASVGITSFRGFLMRVINDSEFYKMLRKRK